MKDTAIRGTYEDDLRADEFDELFEPCPDDWHEFPDEGLPKCDCGYYLQADPDDPKGQLVCPDPRCIFKNDIFNKKDLGSHDQLILKPERWDL